MIPLTAAVSGKLTWSRTSCSGRFQLKVNEEVAGTLNRPSLWSSNLIATTDAGQWTFRRAGFWGTTSEIMDSAGQTIATYKSSWGGKGTLAFADGQRFYIEMNGIFRPVWSVIAESGQPVVQLHQRGKVVELPEGMSVASPRLSLLILFGLYCILQAEEAAAGAAVVAATA